MTPALFMGATWLESALPRSGIARADGINVGFIIFVPDQRRRPAISWTMFSAVLDREI